MSKPQKQQPIRKMSAHDIYKQIKNNKDRAPQIPLEQMAMLEKLLPHKRVLDVYKWRKEGLEAIEAEKANQ